MSLHKLFKTNDKLETKGITITYGNNKAGELIKFRLARAGGTDANARTHSRDHLVINLNYSTFLVSPTDTID